MYKNDGNIYIHFPRIHSCNCQNLPEVSLSERHEMAERTLYEFPHSRDGCSYSTCLQHHLFIPWSVMLFLPPYCTFPQPFWKQHECRKKNNPRQICLQCTKSILILWMRVGFVRLGSFFLQSGTTNLFLYQNDTLLFYFWEIFHRYVLRQPIALFHNQLTLKWNLCAFQHAQCNKMSPSVLRANKKPAI